MKLFKRQQTYYWVFGIYKNKPTLLGPFTTEEEAEETGLTQMDTGDFKVYPLPTKNESRATRMIKAMKYEKTKNLDTALEKLSHRYQRTKQEEEL